MKSEYEKYLWDRVPLCGEVCGDKTNVRDTINGMVKDGMINSPKQAWRTLEKWSRRGIYEYGVCLDLGWKLEPADTKKEAP